MTHDYKAALEWCAKMRILAAGILADGCFTEPLGTIESALHLAQEAEQMRKERDDYKALYDVMVERYTELAKKVRGENGN